MHHPHKLREDIPIRRSAVTLRTSTRVNSQRSGACFNRSNRRFLPRQFGLRPAGTYLYRDGNRGAGFIYRILNRLNNRIEFFRFPHQRGTGSRFGNFRHGATCINIDTFWAVFFDDTHRCASHIIRICPEYLHRIPPLIVCASNKFFRFSRIADIRFGRNHFSIGKICAPINTNRAKSLVGIPCDRRQKNISGKYHIPYRYRPVQPALDFHYIQFVHSGRLNALQLFFHN